MDVLRDIINPLRMCSNYACNVCTVCDLELGLWDSDIVQVSERVNEAHQMESEIP